MNADEIARGLSPLRPEIVALKAGRVLLEEVRELISRRESFALESTLSGKSYLALLRHAKESGYLVEVHYMLIPSTRAAIQRVRVRVKKGGHHVPPDDIRRRFERSGNLFVGEYAQLADRWRLWGNANPPAKMLANSELSSLLWAGVLVLGAGSRTRADVHRIPLKDYSPEDLIAHRAHVRATRKMRKELRFYGLPMIGWKNGKVVKIKA
jgi:predicted ABC-type ATPase